MKNNPSLPLPVLRSLRKLGRDINAARRRRRITLVLMSERTGVSRTTVCRIEKGDSTVSIASYALVLFVLGMTDRLCDIADQRFDLVGLQLEDEQLPKRIRIPKLQKEEGWDD